MVNLGKKGKWNRNAEKIGEKGGGSEELQERLGGENRIEQNRLGLKKDIKEAKALEDSNNS